MSASPVTMAGKIARGSLYFVIPVLIYLSTNEDAKQFINRPAIFWAGALAFGLTSLRAYLDTSNGDKHPSEAAAQVVSSVGEVVADSARQAMMDRVTNAAVSGVSNLLGTARKPTEAPVAPLAAEPLPVAVPDASTEEESPL